MRRLALAVSVAASGVVSGWIGQAIWRRSPDEIWATTAVAGVLWGIAIGLERPISRGLARVTGPQSSEAATLKK